MARFLFLLFMLVPIAAGAVTVDDVRTWAGPEQTRIVFDLSGPTEHTLFTLDDPARVVVDLPNAATGGKFPGEVAAAGVMQRLRSGVRDGDDLRIVLDLSSSAKAESFLLRPSGTYGYRLVVDLAGAGSAPAPALVVPAAPTGVRPLVIAIDAGHGGEDPGAVGPRGTYEKDVVLSVAKKLAQLVEKEPGMRPLLIRTGDYYVGLRSRTAKARDQRADMFVSIHADSVASRSARGGSVYTLSRRGATTETARLLAERENSSDMIGGVSLEDKDDLVATVLLDLSRAATVESSIKLADSILGRLGREGRLHKTRVEQAGFVVLKSLDMPSVLVELAFISNPEEEARLRDEAHQWRLARAIFAGIQEYREDSMPQQMPRLTAENGRRHVVRRGDTLSGIAQHYSVSLDTLRAANQLAGDTIAVGRSLVIP